ncbi:MAG: ClpXP protease specificity-enhancing factor SspB [Hyphomicrobiaceae bacterium]|nr:ClpXP protease specificity-enhancing factor SspB [Hyphomicrobiaceae bacterium]
MTTEPMIDYEALAQDAFRGIVRAVLQRAAKSGLPGDHHFYISFDTKAAGVMLSKRLKEKYPSEMTIVLQHRFWDLAVTDERFEVKLTFDGIPERLVVPFKALKVFLDPSVRYGLQFEDPEFGGLVEQSMNLLDGGLSDNTDTDPRPVRRSTQPHKLSRKTSQERVKPIVQMPTANAGRGEPAEPVDSGLRAAAGDEVLAGKDAANAAAAPAAAATDHQNERPREATGAEIVSLDKFRKK